jgi:hypothetical protein
MPERPYWYEITFSKQEIVSICKAAGIIPQFEKRGGLVFQNEEHDAETVEEFMRTAILERVKQCKPQKRS